MSDLVGNPDDLFSQNEAQISVLDQNIAVRNTKFCKVVHFHTPENLV